MVRSTRMVIRNTSGTEPLQWFRDKVRRIEQGGQEVLQDSMRQGEEAMRNYIATRGTPKSGRAGRIDTGEMYGAVASSVSNTGVGSSTGKFGWIDHTEPYFGYQDVGFNHTSGIRVEGMNALVDAGEFSWNKLQVSYEQVIKNA